jgi:hypothetical protein
MVVGQLSGNLLHGVHFQQQLHFVLHQLELDEVSNLFDQHLDQFDNKPKIHLLVQPLLMVQYD